MPSVKRSGMAIAMAKRPRSTAIGMPLTGAVAARRLPKPAIATEGVVMTAVSLEVAPQALMPPPCAPGAVGLDERAQRWRSAQRVLMLRLDGLGSVLMTTPALAAVRQSMPQADLTLLAAPAAVALAPHLPMVDRIQGFDAPW